MLVAGVDEAGRGPLVGSVVAAEIILDPNKPIQGLNDSKKLTEKKREKLFLEIQEKALAWSIAEATHAEIDEFNILQATFLAMRRAVNSLKIQPEKVIVDGFTKLRAGMKQVVPVDAGKPRATAPAAIPASASSAQASMAASAAQPSSLPSVSAEPASVAASVAQSASAAASQ